MLLYTSLESETHFQLIVFVFLILPIKRRKFFYSHIEMKIVFV